MGRNRIEDKFRDRLENREIEPSTGSWEKLSGRLNAGEKKATPLFWWMGIAATLIAGIFAAGLMYDKPAANIPAVVVSPVEDKSDFDEIISSEEKTETNFESSNKTENVKEEKIISPAIKNQQIAVAIETEKENLIILEPLVKEDKEMIAISRKLEDIIAEAGINNENSPDTYEEVEALLYKAATEISLARKANINTKAINPGDLLFAVEMELEESFREKVFEVLKEGYLKARTAVANRNYP